MKTSIKIIISLLLLIILAFIFKFRAKAKILIVKYISSTPRVKKYDPPELTNWKPEGCRKVRTYDKISGYQPSFFRTLHADTMCSDEVSIAIAPVFELAWVAEKEMFIAEGPTFDSKGNIYFCPLWPKEQVILVSLNPADGSRRWSIKGFSLGGGAPLVLNDPETGEQVIYLGTYDRAVAVSPDGNIIWDVSTGLPKLKPDRISAGYHCFGLNYHLQSDALIGVMGDGHIYILDRKTGKSLLASPFMLPGKDSPKIDIKSKTPQKILKKAQDELKHMMEGLPPEINISVIIGVLGGEGIKVANYFAIDVNSGRIWVAATAPDAEDGSKDGVSHYGALYALDLIPTDGHFALQEAFHISFDGGTSSTPSLNADGTRVYIGDAFGKLIAIDSKDGSKIWSLDVEDFIVGSITIAADNGEIYASTKKYFIKVVDLDNRAELIWRAHLDMYKTGLFLENIRVLLAIAGANGIAIQGGVGIRGKGRNIDLIFRSGIGLLDRETGKLRYFTEGVEESVSVTNIGPDGGIYIAHSPIRRAIARAIFGDKITPLIGGIARYKPKRLDLLLRDAIQAAANRAKNAHAVSGMCPASAQADIRQIKDLIAQCRRIAPEAITYADISPDRWEKINALITVAEKNLMQNNLGLAADNFEAAGYIMSQT